MKHFCHTSGAVWEKAKGGPAMFKSSMNIHSHAPHVTVAARADGVPDNAIRLTRLPYAWRLDKYKYHHPVTIPTSQLLRLLSAID